MATVPMLAPDGTSGDIPQAKMQDAIAAGFKLAVPMKAPDGTAGYIPADKQQDAMKAGFTIQGSGTIGPMTQRQRFLTTYPVGAPGETTGENLENVVQNVGVGIFQTADALAHPIRTAEGLVASLVPESVMKAGLGKDYEKDPYAHTENPIQQVYEGVSTRPGEVIPQMAGQALAGEGIGEAVGPVAQALKDKVASARSKIVSGVTKTGPSTTADLVAKTQAANEADAAKAADVNATQEATRQAALKKHFDKTQQLKADNEAGEATQTRKEALNRGVEQLEEQAHDDLKAARTKAADEADAKYKALNSALEDKHIQSEAMLGHLLDASEKIKGSMTEPTIFKDIEKTVKNSDVISYDDLQGYYSELGRELKKGTLPGDIYTAYSTLQEAIGGEMQRIADANNMGPQLTDARNSWRNMKQTFYDPNSPISQAIKVGDSLKRKPGSVMNAFQGKDAAIEALAKYDPDLASRINTIRGYQAEAKAITAKPVVQKPLPSLSDKPAPITPEPRTIGTEDIRAAKAEGLDQASENVRKYGRKIVNYGVGLHALWDAFSGRFNDLPRDFVLGAAGYSAAEGFARLLERPAIREMLTNPTADDIAQIPPELRGNLGPMLQAAQKQGIKVNPALVALVGITAAGPRTQKLKQARDHGRYAHVAVGPNGHRIGSNDGETWVDTETGEPVYAQ